MTPRTEAYRLVCSVLLGAALGGYYGFLRPLRPRRTALSDVLFSLGAGWVWLFHSFYLCRGDIREIHLAGLLLGILAFRLTLGTLLQPAVGRFYRGIGSTIRFVMHPVGKIFKKTNNPT